MLDPHWRKGRHDPVTNAALAGGGPAGPARGVPSGTHHDTPATATIAAGPSAYWPRSSESSSQRSSSSSISASTSRSRAVIAASPS